MLSQTQRSTLLHYPGCPTPSPVDCGNSSSERTYAAPPLAFAAVASGALAWLICEEIQHSYYQSRFISEYAADLEFDLAEGSTEQVIYPQYGPFDQRYGYTELAGLIPRLKLRGYEVTSQARFSAPLPRYADAGLYPPFC